VGSGAAIDRHAADQIIPFVCLANGQSRLRTPEITEHMLSGAWLARKFLGANVSTEGTTLVIDGTGFSVPR
jgi:RNA 3'-terminal phosphate cyclase (ATP)